MDPISVLIIDDENQIRKLLEITLKSNDCKVIQASTAKEGLAMAISHAPDLILLDIGLPDESGQLVLKKLRSWYQKPVIILSVQSDEENIIAALDNGANDYLTKPFRTGELLARIRSSIRKVQNAEEKVEIVYGNLSVDLSARLVKKRGEAIKLTATEYNLLSLLIRNSGRVLTHQYISTHVWGPGYADQSQSLRVFIGQLRKKIEDDFNNPTFIVTESRVGYRFASAT